MVDMKVISLPPSNNEPHKPVIEYLKKLYDRAVAGDVKAIASIVVASSEERAGGTVETGWSINAETPEHGFMVAAGASRLTYEMNRATAWDE